jgi:dTDP-4-dehydrorhamnose reductase
VIEAVENDARGVFHITNSGECSWHEFTVEIMRIAEIDVPIEPAETTGGTVDRPLNGVLARTRTDAAGLTPLRSWRDALADYLQPS